MKISKRLKTISEYINNNSVILDVGCDHALLDIYTVLNKENIKAYASDVKEGPLNTAKDNIKKYKLTRKIKTILMNGIAEVPDDVNTIVISGMGGSLINNILNSNKDKLNNIDNIILSPNNDYIKVRKNLYNIGYIIEDEDIIYDKNKCYLILKLVKGNKKYSNKELFLGPVLRFKKDKDTINYYNDEIKKRRIILSLTPKKYILKRFKIYMEIKMIEKVI